MMVIIDEDALLSMMITVMMRLEMQRVRSPVRPDWRCGGCVVIIIIMTVGDEEDAR